MTRVPPQRTYFTMCSLINTARVLKNRSYDATGHVTVLGGDRIGKAIDGKKSAFKQANGYECQISLTNVEKSFFELVKNYDKIERAARA